MARVLLCSLGSRGDIEPFLALGQELLESGCEVAFCFPAQFEDLAQQVKAQFYPQDARYLDLIDSPSVRQIMAQVGSPVQRMATALKLLRQSSSLQEQLIRDQKAAVEDFAPQRIIFHIKCIYPVIEALERGTDVHLLSPIPCLLHPVAHEASIGFGKPGPVWWNLLSYHIAMYLLISKAILPYTKRLEFASLGYRQVKDFLFHHLPVEYAVSSELFPRPDKWPGHVTLTHFRERNKTRHWQPSPDLVAFLAQRPLYIGFGSMINERPQQLGRMIVELSKELQQPIIVNCSWGGIEMPPELPETIFVVQDVPYDWLFARVCAVVHHGGSGTTHSALQYRVPQLVIPHIADQFLWQRLLLQSGHAVAGFPIKKLTKPRLKKALFELLARCG